MELSWELKLNWDRNSFTRYTYVFTLPFRMNSHFRHLVQCVTKLLIAPLMFHGCLWNVSLFLNSKLSTVLISCFCRWFRWFGLISSVIEFNKQYIKMTTNKAFESGNVCWYFGFLRLPFLCIRIRLDCEIWIGKLYRFIFVKLRLAYLIQIFRLNFNHFFSKFRNETFQIILPNHSNYH